MATELVTVQAHWVADEEGYLLDNQQAEAGQRFDALSELFNPLTFPTSLRSGWGRAGGSGRWAPAGPPFRPGWLSRWGRRARSLPPTSIPPGWMTPLATRSAVMTSGWTRLLVHVPQRDRALAAMVSVLRRGGWLVAEEADPALQPLVCPDETGPAQQLASQPTEGRIPPAARAARR